MPESKKSHLASRLCSACGVCCRGVFFVHHNDPQLYGIDLGNRSEQHQDADSPMACLLLDKQGACLIHEHPERPHICKDSQCQLLIQCLKGEISVERGHEIILEIKRLLENIQNSIVVDGSKPLMDFLKEKKRPNTRSHISPEGAKYIRVDVISFKYLAHRYILPFEWGFIRSTESS